MSIMKGKIEGGQGGKRGHSNMTHWAYTDEIKDASRKLRRHSAKRDVAEGLEEHKTDPESRNDTDLTDELPE
ncbi:MAG TPA: hypothetical protein VIT88_02445 [Pyrinomonadaceae bacterium]